MCHNNLKGRKTECMQKIYYIKMENKNVSELLIKC